MDVLCAPLCTAGERFAELAPAFADDQKPQGLAFVLPMSPLRE